MSSLKNLYLKLKEESDINFQRIDITHSEINNCEWLNHIFISPSIRYGHLEYFKSNNDKIEVVHCVFFPSYFKAMPIFGFDVISLGGKITGLFCDFTPSPYTNLTLQSSIKNANCTLSHLKRDLPGWTEFFSPEFIAIAPNNEYEKAEHSCLDLFDLYIKYSQIMDLNSSYLLGEDVKKHIDGQNKYSLGQRKNSKTQKALASYIGENAAKEFVDNVLFPIFNK